MPMPKNRKELEAAGYSFKELKTCRCDALLEMWNTPRGRVMPLDFKTVDGAEVCEAHFASCPYAADYSQKMRDKAKKKEQAASDVGPMS